MREQQQDLTLLGSIIGLFAAAFSLYTILTNWSVIRRRLFASFLKNEERRIHERKTEVALRFQRGSVVDDGSDLSDVHAKIDRALSYFDAGRLDKADAELAYLQSTLSHRSNFAEQQRNLADTQIAAVHLFRGSISAARRDASAAIEAFKKARSLSANDTDAPKYIAEQYFVLGDSDPQQSKAHYRAALDFAQEILITHPRPYSATSR